MRLIGLIGRARVGKDTVADHLELNHNFRRYAFADPLKDMLEVVFGDKFRSGNREAPIDWLGKSPRHLMQTLGTEWGRDCVHPDLWVLLGEQQVKLAAQKQQRLVISDVRFHNEADMILRNGGELWHIARNNSGTAAGHRSEMSHWDSYPQRVLVSNEGTLDELYARVDALL